MRSIMVWFLLLVSASPLLAQDWARARLEKSPRHGEWVAIKHNGRAVETFVVYPEAANKTPVVLIIHEIFGMTDWVQDLADQVAEAGYIAVAPDLLSGMGPNGGRSSSFPAGQGMGSPATAAVSHLNPDQVTADLNAVADYANKIPASNGKLYVAGFCWGGGQSFRFATHRTDLAAAFVFYGPPPLDLVPPPAKIPPPPVKNPAPPANDAMQPKPVISIHTHYDPAPTQPIVVKMTVANDNKAWFTAAKDVIAHITAPIYGFYAGNDARIGATVPQTIEAMKAAGKVYDPVTYDGAGHGFMRAGEAPDASDANRQARLDAWARWKKLLGGSQ